METSILRNIKKLLGLFDDDTSFDMDILTHINSVLSVLKQVGMQVPTDLLVEDANATWGDLINSSENLALVRSYIYVRVRLLFDPPTSSFALSSFQNLSSELEWRIHVLTDPPFRMSLDGVEVDP